MHKHMYITVLPKPYIKIINKAYVTQVRETLGGYYIVLFAGLLASSQYASGRSCDRPSRHRFSWFSSVFKQMLRRFPISNLLLHASHTTLLI
jgi:hypothetical protein